jgi:hypothetical protein
VIGSGACRPTAAAYDAAAVACRFGFVILDLVNLAR